jgi:hypothetical protein
MPATGFGGRQGRSPSLEAVTITERENSEASANLRQVPQAQSGHFRRVRDRFPSCWREWIVGRLRECHAGDTRQDGFIGRIGGRFDHSTVPGRPAGRRCPSHGRNPVRMSRRAAPRSGHRRGGAQRCRAVAPRNSVPSGGRSYPPGIRSPVRPTHPGRLVGHTSHQMRSPRRQGTSAVSALRRSRSESRPLREARTRSTFSPPRPKKWGRPHRNRGGGVRDASSSGPDGSGRKLNNPDWPTSEGVVRSANDD